MAVVYDLYDVEGNFLDRGSTKTLGEKYQIKKDEFNVSSNTGRFINDKYYAEKNDNYTECPHCRRILEKNILNFGFRKNMGLYKSVCRDCYNKYARERIKKVKKDVE